MYLGETTIEEDQFKDFMNIAKVLELNIPIDSEASKDNEVKNIEVDKEEKFVSTLSNRVNFNSEEKIPSSITEFINVINDEDSEVHEVDDQVQKVHDQVQKVDDQVVDSLDSNDQFKYK